MRLTALSELKRVGRRTTTNGGWRRMPFLAIISQDTTLDTVDIVMIVVIG